MEYLDSSDGPHFNRLRVELGNVGLSKSTLNPRPKMRPRDQKALGLQVEVALLRLLATQGAATICMALPMQKSEIAVSAFFETR